MHFARFATAVIAASLLNWSAQAASVEVIQAPVSVNSGAGYVRISGLIQAKPGDTVMASPNGRARVAYGNGCILEVEPGMVVTVPQDANCTPGAHAHHHYIIGGLVIAGGVAAVILLSQDKSSSPDKPASP